MSDCAFTQSLLSASQMKIELASDNAFVNVLAEMGNTEIYAEHPIDSYTGSPEDEAEITHRPPFESTCQLLDSYFDSIHLAYPFLCQPHFRKWVCDLYAEPSCHVSSEDPETQTVLANFNLVLAIGAFYQSFISGNDEQTLQHVKFYNRARSFELNAYDYPTLASIQFCLLSAFYLLLMTRPRRAYQFSSNAVASSQVLGFNSDRGSHCLSSEMLETQRRVWHSVHILEALLASMLGFRMQSYRCVHPVLPRIADFLPDGSLLELEAPNASTFSRHFYFVEMISFSSLLSLTLDQLYWAPIGLTTTTPLIQTIEALDDKLIQWRDRLPEFLSFSTPHLFTNENLAAKRQRNNLALKFHNLRILIHRKALLGFINRSDPHPDFLPNAETCITEAIATVKLFDNLPDVVSLYWDFPHWQLLNCLMTAAVVLICGQNSEPGLAQYQSVLPVYFDACVKLMSTLAVDRLVQFMDSYSVDRCLQILYSLREAVHVQ